VTPLKLDKPIAGTQEVAEDEGKERPRQGKVFSGRAIRGGEGNASQDSPLRCEKSHLELDRQTGVAYVQFRIWGSSKSDGPQRIIQRSERDCKTCHYCVI